MKIVTLTVLISFLLVACQNAQQTREAINKRIEVEFNPNIHTSHVIELIVWPGEYPTRPMVIEAQKYFEPFANHPAIELSDSLLQNEVFYFDELTEILLYLEDFPSTTFKYPLENSPYADRQEIIKEWIQALSVFYQDANVEGFLDSYGDFYQGAREEVLQNLPPADFVEQIESYYRDNRLKYTIIPAPEMPTGGVYGQRGIGPYVYTPNGLEIYQVISASLPVQKDSLSNKYEVFGFYNKEFVLRNSYHEFGHAFVNPVLAKQKNERLIYKYEHLFVPELKQVMLKQNYDNWFDCIAEHLVRLGEIRLADRSGNTKWADQLRNQHINQLHFVFLNEFEQKIKEYEGDESYESFEEFLPELIGVLELFDEEEIKYRIEKNR